MSKNLEGTNADAELAPPSPRAQQVMAAHSAMGGLLDLATETDMKLAMAERAALDRGESVALIGVDFARTDPEADMSAVAVVVPGAVEPIFMTPMTFLDEGRLEFELPAPSFLPSHNMVALCDNLNSLLELAEATDIDQLSRGLVDLESARQTPLPRRFQI